MAEEVGWLLEELHQFDGSELVEAVSAARSAVAALRHHKRSHADDDDDDLVEEDTVPRRRRRSLQETAASHPVKEGARRFVALSSLSSEEPRESDHLAALEKAPTIEELRKRLLEDEDQEEGSDDLDNEDAKTGGFSELSLFEQASAFDGATETKLDDLEQAFLARQKASVTLGDQTETARAFDEAAERESQAAQRAMRLLSAEISESESALSRGALVKTVGNEQWDKHLLPQLRKTRKSGARPFYSPCTLPPRACVGMRLFGRVWAQSCGVVFDRAALKLPEDVWAWRSGFFAKTEFGVTSKTTQDKNLRGELADNLASLDELERMANAKEYEHFGERKTMTDVDNVVPYNEVFAPLRPEAAVAVFARTTQVRHLLLAMAARDALERVIVRHHNSSASLAEDATRHHERRRVALLVIDAGGTAPPRPVSLAAQTALLKQIAEADHLFPAGHQRTPFSVLPETALLGLELEFVAPLSGPYVTPADALLLHATAGVAESTLRRVLGQCAAREAPMPFLAALERHCEATLRRSLARRNATAADAVVRAFAGAVTVQNARASRAALRAAAPFAVPLAVDDDDCLRAAGAFACLRALASARLTTNATQAVDLLNHWLDKAESSLAFRVKAWRDASKHPSTDGGPSFAAFAGHKAIRNRATFRDKLLPLVDDDSGEDPAAALAHLTALVDSVHAPTLRLELLHFITGLDHRWSRDLLLHSCELAAEALNLLLVSSP